MTKRYDEKLEQEICGRYKSGESATSIAKDLRKGTLAITRCLKRNGIEIRKCVGENHPSWKGGRISKGDGYIGIWKPDHERADKQGYVFEHTLVAERMLGRLPIKGEEVVHHINLDKTDNREENLYVCGYRKHTRIHRQLDRLTKPLLELGVLYFDKSDGEYKINPKLYNEIGSRYVTEKGA
ncbi:HNH endonuclease [Bacillus cereus group sp. BfR-BA-01522]|uniref:HNH endonuclease n=1 Tax=Bacillus cereus group sp. BfR-BA-01522 TaxID=2920370 RepID=UPI001F5855B5|nr:HNH endonuclease [Bacillus cereus group sp. BfR-BA-01522]